MAYKSLFKILNKEENLVRLGVRLLDKNYELLFYKKYGNNLNDTNIKENLTLRENNVIAQTITRKLIPNIEYLESLNLKDEEIEYLLLINDKTFKEIFHIGERKCKDFFSYFEDPKYLVELAVKILKEKDRTLLYKKFGEYLSNVFIIENLTDKEQSNIRNLINTKLKNVIEFLKSENIEESEISELNIDELKNKYYSLQYKQYNSLFSYFDCEECYVKLSFYFQTDLAKHLLKTKYGEHFNNVNRQNNLTRYDNMFITSTIIPKMKEVISYLKENNITILECNYLISNEGEYDLETLIRMYKKQTFIKKYIKENLGNIKDSKKYNYLIKKYDLEKAKLILLFIKYEGFITIGEISKLLNADKMEVFDAYITYSLKERKTHRTK